MTEYDYSPDAYERHLEKIQKIGLWVDTTNQFNQADPTTLATPATTVVPSLPRVRTIRPHLPAHDEDDDDDDGIDNEDDGYGLGRHHRQERGRDRLDHRTRMRDGEHSNIAMTSNRPPTSHHVRSPSDTRLLMHSQPQAALPGGAKPSRYGLSNDIHEDHYSRRRPSYDHHDATTTVKHDRRLPPSSSQYDLSTVAQYPAVVSPPVRYPRSYPIYEPSSKYAIYEQPNHGRLHHHSSQRQPQQHPQHQLPRAPATVVPVPSASAAVLKGAKPSTRHTRSHSVASPVQAYSSRSPNLIPTSSSATRVVAVDPLQASLQTRRPPPSTSPPVYPYKPTPSSKKSRSLSLSRQQQYSAAPRPSYAQDFQHQSGEERGIVIPDGALPPTKPPPLLKRLFYGLTGSPKAAPTPGPFPASVPASHWVSPGAGSPVPRQQQQKHRPYPSQTYINPNRNRDADYSDDDDYYSSLKSRTLTNHLRTRRTEMKSPAGGRRKGKSNYRNEYDDDEETSDLSCGSRTSDHRERSKYRDRDKGKGDYAQTGYYSYGKGSRSWRDGRKEKEKYDADRRGRAVGHGGYYYDRERGRRSSR